MRVVIEDVDLGFAAIRDRLEGLDNKRVEAGLFDREQANKGARNEFGTSTIPARPWLSVAADGNVGPFGDAFRAVVEAACDGDDSHVAAQLHRAGKIMANAARAVISEGRVRGPALAPSTVAAKGHDVKLVDTLAMFDAITYEVQS